MKLKLMAPLFGLLALTLLSACRYFSLPGASPELDEGEIYAAAVRQIYHVDHSFGQAPGWPDVFIIGTTDDGVMPGQASEAAQVIPAETRRAVEAALADEPFAVQWIESMDEAPLDPSGGPVAGGDGIVITLGNIHTQDDGTVQLPFFMLCGGLCGIGKTYVLSKVDGRWQVTGSVGPEVMS